MPIQASAISAEAEKMHLHPPSSNTLLALEQACPMHSSIAFCLNRLREAHIQFLNLGNLIICPSHNGLIIFQSRLRVRIEALAPQQS